MELFDKLFGKGVERTIDDVVDTAKVIGRLYDIVAADRLSLRVNRLGLEGRA